METSFDVFLLNQFKTTIKKEMKIEIREMVSFELGKEIEKDVFSSCHERGTKKKILSSFGETFRFCAPML